jgi:GTP-binding protein Era
MPSPAAEGDDGIRSGFVVLAGRPNVGKSTLVNRICGAKVSIVSDKPQTTRLAVRGILDRPDAQVVFVDTPGLHKPRTALGHHLNRTSEAALAGVDVACLVLDATAAFGRGDRWVADRLPAGYVVAVNKADWAGPSGVGATLAASSELPAEAWFPVSARTGDGVDALVSHLVSRLPVGPRYYPSGTPRDLPDDRYVAELVREQLLAVTSDELPYSIATRVTEWEWPRVRVEIVVERESQKGIVIGAGGSRLKEVGTAVRRQLPPGAFVELAVTVDKDWQRRPDRVRRLYDEP